MSFIPYQQMQKLQVGPVITHCAYMWSNEQTMLAFVAGFSQMVYK